MRVIVMGVSARSLVLLIFIVAGAILLCVMTAGVAESLQVPIPSGPILYEINDTGVLYVDSNNGRIGGLRAIPVRAKTQPTL